MVDVRLRTKWLWVRVPLQSYKLDLANFLSAPGLALQACLKKTEVKLELLTDTDMLMIIEEGICQAV